MIRTWNRAGKRCGLALVVGLTVLGEARGATPPPKNDVTEEIDRLFAAYDRSDAPGCSLGVIRAGEFLLKRSYGMANLEHGVPISEDSVFRTGSVGKQFTAFAVLLAERMGLLSLDDDIRKYLPELPPTERTITIRHLVHHTSGLRDYLTLMSLAGVRDEDFYTEADVMERLSRQENLNFLPGSEYLYSNTGYFLISQILPRATGTTLRQFAEKHVFGPLGMTSSHFHDDFREIVPRRADGYRPVESGGFEIDMTTLNMVGDGGVFTSVNDLLHWERNFETGERGGKALAAKRVDPERLTDGTTQTYAFGLAMGTLDGRRTVSHGGAFVGFRSAMLRVPEERLAVYLLCNSSAVEPMGLAREVARLYLHPVEEPEPQPESVSPSREELEGWAGTYFASDTGALAEIALGEEGLVWREREAKLAPVAPGEFRLAGEDEDPTAIVFSVDEGLARMTVSTEGQREFAFEWVEPVTAGIEQLARYAGLYRCRELDATYRLEIDAEGRLLMSAPGLSSVLEPVFDGGFRWTMGSVVFAKDSSGRPIRFELAAGRARNFVFDRL